MAHVIKQKFLTKSYICRSDSTVLSLCQIFLNSNVIFLSGKVYSSDFTDCCGEAQGVKNCYVKDYEIQTVSLINIFNI